MQKKIVNSNPGLVLFNPKIGPLSSATTLGQSGPGSDGNKGVLRIPQSSSITGTSPSDCLVWYPEHLLGVGGSYPSAEKQSVYSTAPADWTKVDLTHRWNSYRYLPPGYSWTRAGVSPPDVV